MFRTRDFILLFTAITFLVSAIGATIFVQNTTPSLEAGVNGALEPSVAATSERTYQAVVATRQGLDRENRIAEMRQKIAQKTELTAPAPEVVASEEVVATTSNAVAMVGSPELCATHAPYLGFWDARNLSVTTGEGAVLVVRSELTPAGSSTQSTLLQLPGRTVPAPDQSCINADVVGIANDGSLIRNDELALYSVFTSDVRIGYALDGFPIYGTGAALVDECGGRMVQGQYRYELQADQEAIITCFSAPPVMLP